MHFASGYRFRLPDEETRVWIHAITDMVKAGKQAEAGVQYKAVIEQLWAVEKLPVVAACTELPVAYQQTGLPPELCISSLEALADGCIRELYKPL